MSITRLVENDMTTILEDGTPLFWLRETLQDDTVLVQLGGQLRSAGVHEFSDEMLALLSVGKRLAIDFEAVTYISAAFMKALLVLQQTIDEKKTGELRLLHVTGQVAKEFDQTGFAALLWIE